VADRDNDVQQAPVAVAPAPPAPGRGTQGTGGGPRGTTSGGDRGPAAGIGSPIYDQLVAELGDPAA
jgi:hypothetical protein